MNKHIKIMSEDEVLLDEIIETENVECMFCPMLNDSSGMEYSAGCNLSGYLLDWKTPKVFKCPLHDVDEDPKVIFRKEIKLIEGAKNECVGY